MAILFFEGLPGAGKSYEAMATQIIPMLKKGREVVAYIEGLNHERIAQAAELPLDRVQELLFVVTREQMRSKEVQKGRVTVAVDGEWLQHVRDNAFHVFDEAQNWWPNKMKATEELTQFVTEHRHRGIDILLMGQSLLDVLALWRRRVDQKFSFLKLTALGSNKRYRVIVYKGQGNDQFVKVQTKLGKYDAKYFGTYSSHVGDDTNTETYTDDRAGLLKTPLFAWGIPIALVAAVWGAFQVWGFFHPEPVKPKPGSASAAVAQGPMLPKAPPPTVAAPPAPAPEPEVLQSAEERYFRFLADKARPRLAGYVEGAGRRFGVVEWHDAGMRVIARLTIDQLEAGGVHVHLVRGTMKLTLGAWSEIATMWPTEAEGRISEVTKEKLRPADDAGLPASSVGSASGLAASHSPGFIFIGDRGPDLVAAAPPVEPSQPQRIGSFKR